MRRTKENKLEVVAVRLDPVIAHRLRLLASVTGRKQSVFLQQIIESGLGAIEDKYLPADLLEQIRSGRLPPVPGEEVPDASPDLFGDGAATTFALPRKTPKRNRVETGDTISG